MFLAIDTRVAAEAIRLHYSKVQNPDLPREYLEKIVQIPISVPIASRDKINDYLDSLMSIQKEILNDEQEVTPKQISAGPKPVEGLGSLKDNGHDQKAIVEKGDEKKITTNAGYGAEGGDSPIPNGANKSEPGEAALEELPDTKTEYETIAKLSELFLESNPRRIKRLLNTYRYIKMLANLRGEPIFTAHWQKTMIAWLTFTMKWPVFMAESVRQAATLNAENSVQNGFLIKKASEIENKIPMPSVGDVREYIDISGLQAMRFWETAGNFLIETPEPNHREKDTAEAKLDDTKLSNGKSEPSAEKPKQLSQKHISALPVKSAEQKAMKQPLIKSNNQSFLHIIPVHLSENRRDITRYIASGRAYPLGETDKPVRKADKKELKIKSLIEIIYYLDCENNDHLRYRPKGREIYGHVYVYDYCYLAGVYLPRVWWTDSAFAKIYDSKEVKVNYGTSVREVNTNMLHDWFKDYGHEFGWKRVLDLDILQAAANNGEVCVIVAQHRNLNNNGNITIVAPEHDSFKAARDATGAVLRPVESIVGTRNYRFVVKPKAWWKDTRYREFSFWRHV